MTRTKTSALSSSSSSSSSLSLNPFACFACGHVDTTTTTTSHSSCLGMNNMRMHSASFRNENLFQSQRTIRRSRSSERLQPEGDGGGNAAAAAAAADITDAESYESYDDSSMTQQKEEDDDQEEEQVFLAKDELQNKSTVTTVATTTWSSSRGTSNGIDAKHAGGGGEGGEQTLLLDGRRNSETEKADLRLVDYRHTGHHLPRTRHESSETHRRSSHHNSTRNSMFHRRSISDPLDAQELYSIHQYDDAVEDIDPSNKKPEHPHQQQQQQEQQQQAEELNGVVSTGTGSSSTNHQDLPQRRISTTTTTTHRYREPALPTLPRFPVAETRNKNCWSEPPVTIFHVRGDDYFSKKKKIASGPFLLSARGCDLFLSSSSSSGQAAAALDLSTKTQSMLGGRLRSLPTLMINFRFPWGVMLLYFELPDKLIPYISKTADKVDTQALSVPEQVLAKWLLGDDQYKNERLKLIPFVAEGPWVVRNIVTGKPAIIGKRLPVTYQLDVGSAPPNSQGAGKSPSLHHHHHHHHSPLLECTLDIGSSSATAKRIVSVCRRYMSALTVDIGFVIQAETKDELPEQMLGSLRIHGADPLKAPTVSC